VLCSSKTSSVENCCDSDICIQISNTMITPDSIIIEVAMFSYGTRKHLDLTLLNCFPIIMERLGWFVLVLALLKCGSPKF
jgi:hypothetical protein